MSTLKQEFDEELSKMVRDYERRGLEHAAIADSLCWHMELEMARENDEGVEDEAVLTE